MQENVTPSQHLSPDEVTAYVTGNLSGTERFRIEQHLATCPECVAEVAAVHRATRPARQGRSALVAGLAAAAVLVLWLQVRPDPIGNGADELRAPANAVSSRVEVIQPADGAPLTSTGKLLWRSSPKAVTYRLTVTDQAGKEVWSITTPDTSVAPPTVQLARNTVYFWYVDALLPDGSSNTSGVYRFRVSR